MTEQLDMFAALKPEPGIEQPAPRVVASSGLVEEDVIVCGTSLVRHVSGSTAAWRQTRDGPWRWWGRDTSGLIIVRAESLAPGEIVGTRVGGEKLLLATVHRLDNAELRLTANYGLPGRHRRPEPFLVFWANKSPFRFVAEVRFVPAVAEADVTS